MISSLIRQTHFLLIVFFRNGWYIYSLILPLNFLAIISIFSFFELCYIFISNFFILKVSMEYMLLTFIFIYVTFSWILIIFIFNNISPSLTYWNLLMVTKICSNYFFISVNLNIIFFRICPTLFIKLAYIALILKLVFIKNIFDFLKIVQILSI